MIAAVKQHAGLTYRLASQDEADSRRFCELSNALYARKVDDAYYRWQFFAPPFPSLLSYAVTDEGELAGCYGFQLLQTALPGATLGRALDIMVARKFQAKRVLWVLHEFAMEQIQAHKPVAAYAMANKAAAGVYTHQLGFKWKGVNTYADWSCATETAAELGAQSIDLTPVASFSVADEAFIQQVETQRTERGFFSLARNREFLEWRFLNNARYDYQVFRCARRGQLFGFVALKIFRDPVSGQTFGDLVDVIWAEDDHATLRELLRFVLNYFHRNQVSEAVTWLQTNTALDQVGRDLGFKQTSREHYLCCKVLDDAYLKLEEPNYWLATMADTELY
jgi:hypothetical protein